MTTTTTHPAGPTYPFGETLPAPGETIEVRPGVHWLRMPLPFALDHINLWLLADGEGWVIVDTGLGTSATRETMCPTRPPSSRTMICCGTLPLNFSSTSKRFAGTSTPREGSSMRWLARPIR